VVGGAVVGGAVVGGAVVGGVVVDATGAAETLVRSLRRWRTTTVPTLTASRIRMRAVRPLRIAGFTWSSPFLRQPDVAVGPA